MKKIINFAKGKGLILSIDSNSRSKLWYDILTNQRGKPLEEFIITSGLILMNEERGIPTFETRRGRSWMDLTVCNSNIAKSTSEWTCGEVESLSDHKLIFFSIVIGKLDYNLVSHLSKRYLTKPEDFQKYEAILESNVQ